MVIELKIIPEILSAIGDKNVSMAVSKFINKIIQQTKFARELTVLNIIFKQ